ncbi:MAG: DUF1573 domain-containing protein [Paludibacteraceae bacterium]|nr:DUF1573 domain-containing protein [Paludibacteraceae bacterium]
MKKFMLMAMAALFCLTIAAQNKVSVQFDEKSHDFGTLKEEQGKATTVFTFVNTSSIPVSLKNVRASCGCTTPNWSKAPVAPGAKGEITVTYNTTGRPGSFSKSVTVTVGTDDETITEALRITGKVTPRPKTPEETYPSKYGEIRAREDMVDFGSMFKNGVQERTWELFNTTGKPHIVTFQNLPSHIIAVTPKVTVKPNEAAKVTFKYNSAKNKNYYTTTDKVAVYVDGKPAGTLSIRATLKENFSTLTDAERQKAPICVITPKNVNMPDVKRGAKKTVEFEIKNDGQTPMFIRAIKCEDAHMKATAVKTTVHPGKSTVVTVELDSSAFKAAHYNRKVYVITNDPLHSENTVIVEFTVSE